MNFNPGPKSTVQYPNEKPRYETLVQSVFSNSEYYEIFKEQTRLALSKFRSSVKTRAVSELLDKNIPNLAMIQSNIIFAPPYATSLTASNELKCINVNVFAVDDVQGVPLAQVIQMANKNLIEIKSEKKVISDLQVYKLEKLEEEKRKLQEDFRVSVDWLKVVDLIYFGYLEALAYLAIDKNNSEKIKVFKTAELLLDTQIQKIITKFDRSVFDDPITKANYRLGLQFFILTYYLQINKKEAINILANHKGEWVEAALADFLPETEDEKYETPYDKERLSASEIEKYKREVLEKKKKLEGHHDNIKKELQKLKIENFDDLVSILNVLEVININKNAFNNYMEKEVSKEVYALFYQNYYKFIALMANLNYRTQIFPKLFDVDKTYQKRIEELILNQRRKLRVNTRNLIFIM